MTDAQLQAKSQLLARADAKIRALSPELKQQWEDLLKTHPWVIQEEKKPS